MARNDAFMFDEFVQDLYDGIHGDLSGASIKYILIDNSITPAADDATPRYADYSAYEVSADGGYTTGGIALSGVATSYASGVLKFDDTGNIALSADAGGFEDAYWLILYNDDAAADQAICCVDLGGPVSERTGPFTVTWNASGIFTDTVS